MIHEAILIVIKFVLLIIEIYILFVQHGKL